MFRRLLDLVGDALTSWTALTFYILILGPLLAAAMVLAWPITAGIFWLIIQFYRPDRYERRELQTGMLVYSALGVLSWIAIGPWLLSR